MNAPAPTELLEAVTDELLAHGEFSSGRNNRSNARIAAEVVISMVRQAASVPKVEVQSEDATYEQSAILTALMIRAFAAERTLENIRDNAATMSNGGAWAAGLAVIRLAASERSSTSESLRERIAERIANWAGNTLANEGSGIAEHDKEKYRKNADEIISLCSIGVAQEAGGCGANALEKAMTDCQIFSRTSSKSHQLVLEFTTLEGMQHARDIIIKASVPEVREFAQSGSTSKVIEACAKIAEPWSGFWLDKNSTDADRAVVEVRKEIAAKIRAMAVPSAHRGGE